MSLIDIKNSVETFATIDSPNGNVTLNTKDKLVDDYITIQSNIELEEKTATPTISTQIITPTSGKFIDKVTVNAIQTEEKTATANGVITPTSGKYLSSVTVAVPEWDGDIYIPPKNISGRIFYDDGDNSATYTFYDADMQEITYTDITSLANAVYYQVSGTPTKDRFYVFNNEYVASKQWGKYGTSIGITTDGIGLGKSNTLTALQQTGWEADSIFQYIINCNTNNLGGCSDWYIGSEAEQDKLRTSGLVTWYSNKSIWSAVEDSSNRAYSWYSDYSNWDTGAKNGAGYGCFAQRSF